MMMEILWWSFKKKMGVKTELIFIMYTLRLVLLYDYLNHIHTFRIT